MAAHELVLWPGVILATLIGSGVVGRRLGLERRGVLWLASLSMTVPAVYTFEALVGEVDFLWPARVHRYALYASLAVLALWATAELLVATDLWEKIVGGLQWGAIGLLTLVATGAFLLAMVRLERRVEEGSLWWWLMVWIHGSARFALLAAPALASVVPLSLVWPADREDPPTLVRRAGPAVLLVLVVSASGVGLAGEDLDVQERVPEEALQGHEAVVTVWIEVEPAPDQRSGATGSSWNVTVPLPVVESNASRQTTQLVGELREELRQDAKPDRVTAPPGDNRTLALQGNGSLTLAGDAHTSREALFELARRLRLAGGNASADQPQGLEVRVHGSLCWKPVHDRAFERVLSVRDRANGSVGSDPVGFERIVSDGCAFVES